MGTRVPCASEPEPFHPASETHSREVSQAKRMCAGCPVRQACLTYALAHPVEGIWGGTTTQERRHRRRDQKEAA